MAYTFIGIGLLLLVVGSEAVLRGGVRISKTLGLSPLIIGLLIVSIGTSAPELVVSLHAAARNAPDVVFGNIIGSNIVNILLILGLGALVTPLPSPPKVVWRDGLTMALASVALAIMMICTETITRQMGLSLLVAFALYVLVSFFTDWRRPSQLSAAETRALEHLKDGDFSPGLSFFILLFGFVCLFFGGRFVVDAGIALAQAHHVPQAFIGLTVIAFGASLPELVTTLVASARGQTSIAIGHLIGSNIFNIMFVLGLTAFVHPLHVTPMLAHADVFVMAGSALLLLPMLAAGWRLTRSQGFLLLLGYGAYALFIAWRQGMISPAMLGLG